MGEKGISIFMWPHYVRLCTRNLHSWSHLFPTRSLQSGFFLSQTSKVRIGDYSLEVTQQLSGSEVNVLSTTYHVPQCQGLHGPPNTDSKGFPQTWSLPESSVPSQQKSTLLPTQSPGHCRGGPVFLRVPKHWWWNKVRPVPKIRRKMNSAGPPANCPCSYSSAGACQGLPGMTQARVTMGDPIPLQVATK